MQQTQVTTAKSPNQKHTIDSRQLILWYKLTRSDDRYQVFDVRHGAMWASHPTKQTTDFIKIPPAKSKILPPQFGQGRQIGKSVI